MPARRHAPRVNFSRILFLLLGGAFLGVCLGEPRTYTDRQGRAVQAENLGVSNGRVTLRLANGSTLAVPLAQLSDADQAFLRGEASPAANAATPGTSAVGAPIVWDYDAKPRGVPDLQAAQFRVWIPDATKPVRGMIALVPGTNGDGRGDANAGDWQALATELGFGLIACRFDSGAEDNVAYTYAAKGSGKVLLAALDKFAAEHKRPEVAKAPLLLWGHSAGGQFNYNFACWKPERTIAFVVNEGGSCYETPSTPQTRATPAILFAGEKDTPVRVNNITDLFLKGRSRGALWAFCLEKGLGHSVGPSRRIAQQFFRSVVAMRLPPGASPGNLKTLNQSEGLLAARKGEAVPAAQYKGSLRDVSWLPDAATAALWSEAQP
jgi:pimeloyl-ACP methyl ester carboxylesterase